MANPRINPALLLSPVETGTIAYDPASDRLHQLNPLAALLAELCDGSRDVDTIGDLVAPLLPEGQAQEIDTWIATATQAGLLVWDDGAAAREFSAAELFKLTKRLRQAGKVQTAYLCGKRVVELEPEDWDAWYDLGEIAQCVGRREDARIAYQTYFDHNPTDGEIEHLLIALRDDAPPPRASDAAIRHIYKNFAASYEAVMREELKYAGPERLREAVDAAFPGRTDLSILDLGCGSGLAGVAVRDVAKTLIGIDLSPEMLELAEARHIYDTLEQAEITAWLDGGDSLFDLIISLDCLIYFGDLSQIVRAAARRLKPGGYFAMSMELAARAPFTLTDTGRYQHHPDHVRNVAAKAGLAVTQLTQSFLRWEYDDEVMGVYAMLHKAL